MATETTFTEFIPEIWKDTMIKHVKEISGLHELISYPGVQIGPINVRNGFVKINLPKKKATIVLL